MTTDEMRRRMREAADEGEVKRIMDEYKATCDVFDEDALDEATMDALIRHMEMPHIYDYE